MVSDQIEISLKATSDQDLGEVEPGESYTFPPPERKVVTQSYDLSIQTLLEQWETRILELPEIQRGYVWDDARASRLVESLLLNIPIPIVYFAERDDAIWEIIDGHQRIKSVVRYVNNEFPLSSLMILGELKGLRFFQLPPREQRYLLTRTMRAVVLSPESHPRIKFEVFERLNTGSLALNAQELRNSLYRGNFNRLLRELVHDEEFRRILGSKVPRRRMVDEELILRFFALRDGLDTYQPSLKIFLNDYMRKMQDADERILSELRAVFQLTVRRIMTTLGSSAFRLTDLKGEPTERTLNRALFDAHMLVFSWVTDDNVAGYRQNILRSLATLYEDEEFLDSIRRATGDRARTMTRVRGVAVALKRAGLNLSIPYELKAERDQRAPV
jgi:hypothetical protein